MNFSFLNYAQSSECRLLTDSSVSYAAGALVVHWGWPLRPPQRRHPALTVYRHNPTQTPPPPPKPPLVRSTICRKDLDTQSQYSLLSLSLSSELLSFAFLRPVWSVSQCPRLEQRVWSAVGFEITENQVVRGKRWEEWMLVQQVCSFARMIVILLIYLFFPLR